MRKVVARRWSVMTLRDVSVLASFRQYGPFGNGLDQGLARSVSKLEGTFCMTLATRSRPMPVSMLGLGRGFREPSAWRSNWVKTRFQISR